ncbi:hypothetical protein ACQUQU_04370 [Thalassolituus sp. LLYu03]|uniref:hypothetical protein n=1 Tax=Thalassolituus sp. LLYu03 TaxID=3421656 RepID=UPI003D288341
MKLLLLPLVIMLSACSVSDGLASIDDKELRRQHYVCQHSVNQTVAEIQVCKNVHRECEKRAASGNYVC